MNTVLQPWHLFVVILAGWVNRRQQDVIHYLRTENQVLREVVGKNRIPLTDAQRRSLAIKGRLLGAGFSAISRLSLLQTPFSAGTTGSWR